MVATNAYHEFNRMVVETNIVASFDLLLHFKLNYLVPTRDLLLRFKLNYRLPQQAQRTIDETTCVTVYLYIYIYIQLKRLSKGYDACI